MVAQQRAIAQACLDGAYQGSMTFPDIIGTLHAAGFEGYTVDFRLKTSTYYSADSGAGDGDSVVLPNHPYAAAIAPVFDAGAVTDQIRWAQSGASDYAYSDFCRNVMAAGCAGYMVSFPGRCVVYFGRDAAMHVERF